MKKYRLILGILTALALAATGCQKSSPQQPSGADSAVPPLTVGLMPAVDALPLWAAEEQGFFKAQGVEVQLEQFTSATDRQSALQSGQIDGTITDVIAVGYNVSNGFSLKITTCTSGSFPFLVRSPLVLPDPAVPLKVGVMEVSVTNYLLDTYLPDYPLEKVYINEIPARLEMLGSGQLDLAVVPEPIGARGVSTGLQKHPYNAEESLFLDCIAFTGDALQNKADSIRRFHLAYNQGVEYLKEESAARKLLQEKFQLATEVASEVDLPAFYSAYPPSAQQVEMAFGWVRGSLGKDLQVNYADMVSTDFAS